MFGSYWVSASSCSVCLKYLEVKGMFQYCKYTLVVLFEYRRFDYAYIPVHVLKEMHFLLLLHKDVPAPDQATSGTYAVSRTNTSLRISLRRASYDN